MQRNVTIRELVQRERRLRPRRSPEAGIHVFAEAAKRHVRPSHGRLSAAGRKSVWKATVERLMQARTSLIIAHRLSTIRGADRIAVLNDGVLVETGTHAELLAHSTAYAHLHALQFGSAPRGSG